MSSKPILLLLLLLLMTAPANVCSIEYPPEMKPMSSARMPSGHTLREELPSGIELKRWKVFNESELTGIWFYDETSKKVKNGIMSLWAMIFPGSFAIKDYKYLCENID